MYDGRVTARIGAALPASALRRAALAAALLVPALAACKEDTAKAPAYQSVGEGGAALREAFNAAAGAPRVLVLLAPT